MPISYGIKIAEKEESSALLELKINIGDEGETTPFLLSCRLHQSLDGLMM